MQSSFKHNWENYQISNIISGKVDDVRLLELFLQDYTELFNKKVQPSCNACIAQYHREYIQKIQEMSNDSSFKLHKKREGLPLEFGSPIRVTNANITDEYGNKLYSRYKKIREDAADFLFSEYPKDLGIKPDENVEDENDDNLSLKKLRKKYPNISARSREDFLTQLENNVEN